MPSSMCWPCGDIAQRCAETTFSSRNASARSVRSKMPRRLTQAPRLVETVTSGEVVTMRRASSLSPAAMSPRIRPNASWVDWRSPRGTGRLAGTATGGGLVPARAPARRAAPSARNAAEPSAGRSRPANGSHSAPSGTAMPRWNAAICSGFISPAWLSLWPAKRQAEALDRVGDKAGRPVVGDGVEGVEHRLHVVAGEIGHQPLQRVVVVLVEDRADAGIAVEVALQMLAPALAALVDQRRIERVRAGVDPFAQMLRRRAGRRPPRAAGRISG